MGITKSSGTSKRKSKPSQKEKGNWPFTIVAIGASAGGLDSITRFLQNLSPNTGMAYIYVQHLSPDHKSILTSLLSKETKMKVQEVIDMEMMQPNNMYVIPYNKEIEVTNGHIKLIPRPKNKPANFSIDVLFSSLAKTHKENVIGIVLSGSGSDGTRGLKEIKLEGGMTFAQDDSAKFGSMPKSAINEGVVDFVLSPEEIAKELSDRNKYSLVRKNKTKRAPEDEIENNDLDLRAILTLLHEREKIDFSLYKMSTLKRRIIRRMMIHQLKTIKEYSGYVGQKNNEVELLYKDLLINVTDFFRDSEAFMLLKKNVLAKLLNAKRQGEALRIWVAACATGEEVYSIAIMLFELQDNKATNVPFQIFASDLSADAIKEARIGEYSTLQLTNVSPKRLQRFFTKTKDRYRISQSLRDVCIFAQHNVLGDPPFSRMDFISCRNFLIYLEPQAQKKAISTFHYALNDGGYLMLGKSETIGASTQLFTPINKLYKIYSRKKTSGINRMTELPFVNKRMAPSKRIMPESISPKKTIPIVSTTLSSAFDSVLLSQYIPASVIISHDMEILQFRGQTSSYLQQSSGKASFNILKMVNTEITFELRNAIHHAIKSKQAVRKEGIEMNRDVKSNTVKIVNLEVAPLKIEGEEPLLVVVFTGQQMEIGDLHSNGPKNSSIAKDRRIRKLEEEIASARQDMGVITHDQEVANEELQSANEEAVSSNEELQSLNEELETSKEEIESTNEELITTNQELHSRIQQVEELYSYYEGILTTIHEPMLILDKNMRIKSVNSSFSKVFHVREEESVGISLYKLNNSQWNIPRLRELLEDIVPKNNRFHDFEVEYEFPVIGNKTLLLNAHRIIQQAKNEELVVLTFIDVTEVKRLAIELQVKEKKVLEVQLEAEKKMLKKIEESNTELIEAKDNAELKAQIAEEAVKVKQQFLSNMSHEIRTPMNAIVGFTKVLLKTNLSDKQNEFLQAIKTSGETLTVLINDILDLAKVDAGKMSFEQTPFKMETAISSMLHLFEIKIKEKNLVLVKEYDKGIPEILMGDPTRLHQIILNLVSNAIKFTTKGKISVSVNLLSEDEEKVTIEFSVTDTGIGIPQDKIGTIFEIFQQADSGTARLYGGTGLGLAIVKQLVEPQGGSINVISKVGQGSTFSFILNFNKIGDNTIVEPNITESTRKIENVKILVVEDIMLNQLLMKTLLSDFGFEYDIASNGKIAIEKLQVNTYDIILMDLQMPEMNGFEATEYIRNVMNSKIPIIALTADVTTVDLTKCTAVGMNDYISKPLDDKLLYDKIVSLVKPHIPIVSDKSIERAYTHNEKLKYVNLSYLTQHSKSNSKLILEMISIYLEQTPPLIKAMKQGLHDKDWNLLQSSVHKMVPSFSIMGISKEFENLARKVQEDANNIQLQANAIPDMVSQLENVCTEACKELEEEFNRIKESNSKK
jgi:two-component system CheB/CheR fusion protein